MPGTSWHAAYTSDLQSLYGLLVVPLAFLAYRLAAPMEARRAVDPASARFVSGLTLIFAVLTMIDPIIRAHFHNGGWWANVATRASLSTRSGCRCASA